MTYTAIRKKLEPSKQALLNFTVGDALCRDRYLTNVINKLHKAGIVRLGHLIQLTDEELREILPTTPDNHDRVKRCLSAFGLELGTEVCASQFASSGGFPPRLDSAPRYTH